MQCDAISAPVCGIWAWVNVSKSDLDQKVTESAELIERLLNCGFYTVLWSNDFH